MSKHLPKTSKHLEDDDVKIWNKDPDEDGDVKIWHRPSRGESAQRAVQEDADERDGPEELEDEDEPELSRRDYRRGQQLTLKRLLQVVAAGVLLVAAVLLPTEGLLRIAFFAVPLLAAGFDLLLDAIEAAIYGEVVNESLLICLAAIAAFVLGAYVESVLIVLLLRIVRLLGDYASEKSRAALDRLELIRSGSANVETAEGVLSVSPDYVNIGDVIVVEPGERVTLDGVVIQGITDIDAEDLTGEEKPRNVSEGGRVFSGTVNLTRTVRVRVTSSYRSSTANRTLRFARRSAAEISKLQRFTQSFGKIYMPAVLLAAIALAVVPSISDGQWSEWARRAVILLAMSGAGVLSTSVSLEYTGSLGGAAKRGVLINGPDCLETLARTETLVFDKTGTITEGRPVITDVFPVGVSERELLTVAAVAERRSVHPVARALRQACEELPDIDGDELQTEEIPGRGVSALVGGRRIYVGNAALLEEHGIRYAVPGRSGAAIHVAVDGKYLGHILVTDKIREGAFDAMESLRVLGVRKLVMLTGDVLSVARPIASKLNFDMLRSELRPEEKAAAVDYLMKNRGERSSVVFVGDGISDGAALERADLGVAMGALGCDGAIEAADVLIMGEDICALPRALSSARSCCANARINTGALLLEKLALIALGALGLTPLGIAVGVDALFSVAALLNSMRSLNEKQRLK